MPIASSVHVWPWSTHRASQRTLKFKSTAMFSEMTPLRRRAAGRARRRIHARSCHRQSCRDFMTDLRRDVRDQLAGRHGNRHVGTCGVSRASIIVIQSMRSSWAVAACADMNGPRGHVLKVQQAPAWRIEALRHP
jgi:hypothetical protein